MKYLLPLLAMLLLTSSTSCIKKYTCTCTSYDKTSGELYGTPEFSFSGSYDGADWDSMCNNHFPKNVDSTNYYSTTTECIAL